MKKCAQCGGENQDDATQCRQCGTEEFVVPAPEAPPEQLRFEGSVESAEFDPDVSPTGARALCISCLFPNLPDTPWCKRCGAPIGATVTLAPLESTHALGFAYRAAVRGHPKVFVVIGIWVLFFPNLLASAAALSLIISSGMDLFVGAIVLWFCIGSGAFSVAMLYQVTNNYLTIPKPTLDGTDA